MNNSCEKQIEIGVENDNQTILSCSDCPATIATTRIPRIRKGVGKNCPAFREERRAFFALIPETGRVSRENCNSLFYKLLAFGHVLN